MLAGNRRWTSGLVLVGLMTLVSLVACSGTGESTQEIAAADHDTGGLVAEPNAPTLEAQLDIGQSVADVPLHVLGGETVHIGDYAGKVVMLFFWSTEVHPRGGPEQASTHSAFLDDDGLVVFAVNSSNDSEAAIEFYIKDFSRGLPVVIDADQSLMRMFGAGLQTTVWIGPQSDLKSISRTFRFTDMQQENVLYRVNYYLNEQGD